MPRSVPGVASRSVVFVIFILDEDNTILEPQKIVWAHTDRRGSSYAHSWNTTLKADRQNIGESSTARVVVTETRNNCYLCYADKLQYSRQ